MHGVDQDNLFFLKPDGMNNNVHVPEVMNVSVCAGRLGIVHPFPLSVSL